MTLTRRDLETLLLDERVFDRLDLIRQFEEMCYTAALKTKVEPIPKIENLEEQLRDVRDRVNRLLDTSEVGMPQLKLGRAITQRTRDLGMMSLIELGLSIINPKLLIPAGAFAALAVFNHLVKSKNTQYCNGTIHYRHNVNPLIGLAHEYTHHVQHVTQHRGILLEGLAERVSEHIVAGYAAESEKNFGYYEEVYTRIVSNHWSRIIYWIAKNKKPDLAEELEKRIQAIGIDAKKLKVNEYCIGRTAIRLYEKQFGKEILKEVLRDPEGVHKRYLATL